MHVWPAFAVPPQTMRSAAYSASASAATTTDALPPSSSVTRFIPARFFSPHPTGGLPVKVSSLIRSSSTSGAASAVVDGTTAMPSSGQPASSTICASLSALIGVWLAGRTTIGLPAASAGATLCATRLIGKLNGLMPAIGPSGMRRTWATRPSLPGIQSSGTISP